MEELQKTTDMSWIEVQFMRKAVETVLECRMTLKWTYCFAYYLEPNSMTEMFEDNQRDLEMAVENLNELLERPIDESTNMSELKQQVLDKSVYVAQRRNILLEDTAAGMLESAFFYFFYFSCVLIVMFSLGRPLEVQHHRAHMRTYFADQKNLFLFHQHIPPTSLLNSAIVVHTPPHSLSMEQTTHDYL